MFIPVKLTTDVFGCHRLLCVRVFCELFLVLVTSTIMLQFLLLLSPSIPSLGLIFNVINVVGCCMMAFFLLLFVCSNQQKKKTKVIRLLPHFRNKLLPHLSLFVEVCVCLPLRKEGFLNKAVASQVYKLFLKVISLFAFWHKVDNYWFIVVSNVIS